MKKRKCIVLMIITLFVCCLCILAAGGKIKGEAAQKTVSMTEFYNNGVFGDGYSRAREGAVVTISTVEEMRLFLDCLYDHNWTLGISFRQETDIAFSNYTFDYNPESKRLLIKSDGSSLEHYGIGLGEEDASSLGLDGIYLVFDEEHPGQGDKRAFFGQYDGQGYSISGFIGKGNNSLYGGLFGLVGLESSVRRVRIRNGLFNGGAMGVLCGSNFGLIEECSVESTLGDAFIFGGIACVNDGTICLCRVDHMMLYSMAGQGLVGGIVADNKGKISDCAVGHLKIKMIDIDSASSEIMKTGFLAGGIAGQQKVGQIINCSSLCEFFDMVAGGEKTGGIVGSLETGGEDIYNNYTASEISNCISAGRICGNMAGGIVGKTYLTESAKGIMLKNNLSLAVVQGAVAGGLVGQLDGGQVMNCYAYDKSQVSDIVGMKNAGSLAECYAVNQEQVYGGISADVIDAGSTYGNTKMLVTALNNGAEDNSDYSKWKTGVLGYPILSLDFDGAPAGSYELGSEIEVSLDYRPEVTTKPLPANTPETVVTPVPNVTQEPSASPSPNVTLEPSVSPPSSNQESGNKQKLIKKLAVKNLKAGMGSSLYIRLSWNKNQWADGYHILRSGKYSSGYKVIGKTSASKTVYLDKKAKRGHTYYYMVRGYAKNAGSTVYGNGQKKRARTAWYQAPVLRLSAGETSDGRPYVQVGISKYSGSYIEVYFKLSGQNYVKAPLKNKRIAFYNGKLRFSYKTKSLLYCKVRTYEIKKGKKQYSAFSKERKIRL